MGWLGYTFTIAFVSMHLLASHAGGLAHAAPVPRPALRPGDTGGPHWPGHARNAGRHVRVSPARVPPRPVAVYTGGHLMASGLRLATAIRRAQGLLPFAIKVPRFVPAGYVPVQLAVTAHRRGVSAGLSTLTYVYAGRGHGALAMANGFQIDQAAHAIPYVGGMAGRAIHVGGVTATVHEFTGPGTDIVVLTWVDARGHGFSLLTPAQWSHLSVRALVRIAVSLQ